MYFLVNSREASALQISTLKSSLKKPVYPMGDYVSRAFLVAMASLIGSYRDALRLKPVSSYHGDPR